MIIKKIFRIFRLQNKINFSGYEIKEATNMDHSMEQDLKQHEDLEEQAKGNKK